MQVLNTKHTCLRVLHVRRGEPTEAPPLLLTLPKQMDPFQADAKYCNSDVGSSTTTAGTDGRLAGTLVWSVMV